MTERLFCSVPASSKRHHDRYERLSSQENKVFDRPSHIILAASDRGVQFANAYELIRQESSETLEDRDPKFPYVGYKRFHVGDKSYVVRFQWPCT